MINTYLIRSPNDHSIYPGSLASKLTGYQDAEYIYDVLLDRDPTQPGDTLIGGWNRSGAKVAPFDLAEYERIRPLANKGEQPVFDDAGEIIGMVESGEATAQLKHHEWSGFAERLLGDETADAVIDRIYPEGNRPLTIEMRQRYVDYGNPAWDGWYWRAEILGEASTRDPSVRAIYQFPESDQGDGYTTAAFILQDSEWQTDDQGAPIPVWATEAQVGRGMPNPANWKLGVLWASAVEGWHWLRSTSDRVTRHYWEQTRTSQGRRRKLRDQNWRGNPYSLDPADQKISYRFNSGPRRVAPFRNFLRASVIEHDFRLWVWERLQIAGFEFPRPRA